MEVKLSTTYEVDVDHLDPKHVAIREFACNEACRMLQNDLICSGLCAEDFNIEIVGEDLYFDKPTQLKVEERTEPNGYPFCYGAIGFRDKIICMDNGHVHPTCAVGDYLTIVEKYNKWLDLSDEVIGT